MTTELYIDGLTDQDNGFLSVYNTLGQLVVKSPLQELVDVTMLQPGTYYVGVLMDGKHSKAVPVLKAQ